MVLEDPTVGDRWYGIHLLILAGLALAAPLPATLTAVVHDGGRITGQLQVPPGTEVVDLLSRLPDPDKMLHRIRTFPGQPNTGRVTYVESSPGVFDFTTQLPRRFGGIGHTSQGTYAHGGFYPQPLIDGQPPEIEWTVAVELPSLGMVGGSVGDGTVEWSGRSDRVTLALPRNSRAWILQTGEQRVVILGKRRPRRALWRHLGKVLPSLGPIDVVLAEAPLRRRLFRTGAGSGLISDRIFRLTPPFQTFHRPALVDGLEATHSRQTHPQLRELVGWTRATDWMKRRDVGGAAGFTRFFSWVPAIDSLLSSRQIPFYRETFREVPPGDPVRDDLFEVLAPHRPGAQLAAQIDDTWGQGQAMQVSHALEQGLSLAQAFQLNGLMPQRAEELRRAVPEQNYTLKVDKITTITRVAPMDAPAETVMLKIDGKQEPVQIAPGGTFSLERPSSIRVDPKGHVSQTSRSGDAWPVGKLRATVTSWTSLVNLTRFRFEGGIASTLRGRYDNRNRFGASLSTDRAALARMNLNYTYKFGPLLFGITRRHRLRFTTGVALLDPRFQSLDDGRVSLNGSVRWSYANFGGSIFPVRGYAWSVGAQGTLLPDGATRRGRVSGSARGVLSPHPRHAFAGRVTGGLSRATRTDLLATLGGPSRMRSLPVLPPCGVDIDGPCAQVATDYVVAAGEYRLALLRGLSVPAVGLFWGSECQVTVGLEAAAANLTDGPGLGLGATAGLAVGYDNWGAEPVMVGFTAGWPLWGSGLELAKPTDGVPEVYLRFGQAL